MINAAQKTSATDLPDDWDDWLLAQGDQASFLQSSHWARLNQIANGNAPFVVEAQSAVGARQIAALFAFEGSGRHIAHSFRAPVIADGADTSQISEFLHTSEKAARKRGAGEIRIEGFPAPRTWPTQILDNIDRILLENGYHCVPWMTSLIDLSVGAEALFNGFKHSLRKGIRKCEKDGIRIDECGNEDQFVEKFWHAYYETETQDDRARLLWNHPSSSFYKYFVALDANGTVLACLGAYEFNGIVTEIMSHRTAASYKIKAPVQDYLHWEIFKTYIARGAQYFDLAGYNPKPVDSKEAGIATFKTKWGGTEVSVPIYTKDLRPLPIRMARSGLKALRAKFRRN